MDDAHPWREHMGPVLPSGCQGWTGPLRIEKRKRAGTPVIIQSPVWLHAGKRTAARNLIANSTQGVPMEMIERVVMTCNDYLCVAPGHMAIVKRFAPRVLLKRPLEDDSRFISSSSIAYRHDTYSHTDALSMDEPTSTCMEDASSSSCPSPRRQAKKQKRDQSEVPSYWACEEGRHELSQWTSYVNGNEARQVTTTPTTTTNALLRT